MIDFINKEILDFIVASAIGFTLIEVLFYA